MRILTIVFVFFGVASVSAQTPQQVEREILSHLTTISANGTYGGSYNDEKVYAANNALIETLKKAATSLANLKYSTLR